MSSFQMKCVCMQVEVPEICHFKNDEQKFMALSHMDMPGQEGSDVRMRNHHMGALLLRGVVAWRQKLQDSPKVINKQRVLLFSSFLHSGFNFSGPGQLIGW